MKRLIQRSFFPGMLYPLRELDGYATLGVKNAEKEPAETKDSKTE